MELCEKLKQYLFLYFKDFEHFLYLFGCYKNINFTYSLSLSFSLLSRV